MVVFKVTQSEVTVFRQFPRQKKRNYRWVDVDIFFVKVEAKVRPCVLAANTSII